MLSRRLQILLDEERFQRLAGRARRRGTSLAALVREAIDIAFPARPLRRKKAAMRILSAESMPVPDPQELRNELERVRSRRG